MNTPICDFVKSYADSDALRLHMPGHKGKSILGTEHLDITEIQGADSLYEAKGIIRESEQNASRLFGCDTYYSTEGSSLCIRAMLCLLHMYAEAESRKPLILAGRNAHKTFLSACALLDFDVNWLYPADTDSYLSCLINSEELDKYLCNSDTKPVAVYLTSPDYLGNISDIKSIAGVCHKHGVLLLVDNAHGAYLRFFPESLHPIDLGADMCCDSAHKTLPVLTGGAYLHISPKAPDVFTRQAKSALSMFGSTSPSYLILQSLDLCNEYLENGYGEKLGMFSDKVSEFKDRLISHGYTLQTDEPLKITLCTKAYGYTGTDFADILLKNNITYEFADPDYVVFMLTPELSNKDLLALEKALTSIEKRSPISTAPPAFSIPEAVTSVRKALLSLRETIPVTQSMGRILAEANVGCPPAVPIIMCGERIDEDAIDCFLYYGITECVVINQ
ncbi:MAG: aminotransferase class V-fold PLP-dependent enzyme [Clostridia bacterium]|nr:aminotransferase class V-fold PLP-dependent enzyme [Clostridia bacterium]